MTRSWLFLIPIMAGVAPLAAQLTQEQRQQREAAAQYTTIGDTRQRDAERLEDMDPLRGLRCGSTPTMTAAAARCSSALRGAYATQRWPGEPTFGGGTSAAPRETFTGASGTGPEGIHFAAFGTGVQRSYKLHPLGTLPVSLRADRSTSLTLASPIGGPGRTLMIHIAVRAPDAEPVWSWMREAAGDEQGRYLVPVPSISAGKYELLVEVYDLERPLVPFSISHTTLNVR